MKYRILAAVPVLALVLMGASECNLDNPPRNETCTITSRVERTITTKCVDQHGKDTGGGGTYDVPRDMYPNCVVGTYWEACKQSVS